MSCAARLPHATQAGNDIPGAPESISVWKAAEGIAYVSGILGCVTGLMITLTFMDKGGLGFKIATFLAPGVLRLDLGDLFPAPSPSG